MLIIWHSEQKKIFRIWKICTEKEPAHIKEKIEIMQKNQILKIRNVKQDLEVGLKSTADI